MKLAISILLSSAVLMASNLATADNEVPYPKDYRSWTHVKSMIIQPGHPLQNPFQGIHHVYANKKALSGLNGSKYSDGSVLVFDLLNYVDNDKTIQEGTRKLTGIMHKNSKKYSQTGGWGFEGFAGNSKTKRLVNDGGASCFSCHQPQKSDDFVFSKYRD